jgi:hypothetical protein
MSTQKHSPATPSFLPTKEFVTDQQVSACLSVLRELQPYAFGPPMHFFAENPPERPELDGGVKSAVQVAIMSVCDRLEKIMTDEKRWEVSGTTDIFKELAKTQKAQQAFLIEQAKSAHVVQLPHYLLRPEIMCDGSVFIAVWGNKDLPGGRIFGQGRTPNEALADFDEAFNRTPGEQIQLILEQNQPPPSDQP